MPIAPLNPMDQALNPQGQVPDMSTMYPQGRPQPNFADGNQFAPPQGQAPYAPQLASLQQPVAPIPGQPLALPDEALRAPQDLPEGIPALNFGGEAPAKGEDVQGERPNEIPPLDFGGEAPAEAPEKEQPGFLKKLDAINTGVHRGVTHFTYKLLSMIPSETTRANIKKADRQLEIEHQKNIEAGMGGYAKGGEIAGEILATMPAGAALGGVMKGASLAGKLAPIGLKTAAKYGTAGVGGAGTLAAMESQRYDPENPEQLLNVEAAGNVMTNPLSYALPMAGAKLGAWAEQSRKLQQGREIIPQLLPRDVLSTGATRKMSHKFFDSLPAVTGMGKRINQLESIGPDINNVVRKISGGNDALFSKDLTKFAATKLQMGLKRLKAGESELWKKPFLKSPIKDVDGVKDVAREAFDVIDDLKGAIPLSGRAKTLLQKGLRKQDMKVDDVKNMQSVLGDVISSVRESDAGGLGRSIAGQLTDIRTRLGAPIAKSISEVDMKDFMAAKAYSSNMFEMQRQFPKIKRALTDEVAAKQIIKSVLQGTTPKGRINDILSPRGQNAMKAAKIADALEKSDVDGKINLSGFINKTAEKTNTPEILGDSYDAIKGLNRHLSSIKEATHIGGDGMLTKATALAATVTYPAAAMFANHPPLKRIAGALSKNLSNSSYKYLTEAMQKHLTRAGFIYSRDDGVLRHKDELE